LLTPDESGQDQGRKPLRLGPTMQKQMPMQLKESGKSSDNGSGEGKT